MKTPCATLAQSLHSFLNVLNWISLRRMAWIKNSHNGSLSSNLQIYSNEIPCASFMGFYLVILTVLSSIELERAVETDKFENSHNESPTFQTPKPTPPKSPLRVSHPMKDAEKRRAEFGKGLLFDSIPRTDKDPDTAMSFHRSNTRILKTPVSEHAGNSLCEFTIVQNGGLWIQSLKSFIFLPQCNPTQRVYLLVR